ncbi:hypothetical protein XELAEV_18039509mg [Xenopus laevis]|uniref:Uncharacterized protein n=1 Tax=Xenopus laevis TaxID=8355 RepID=A0A974C7X4_XENLA|nr:hypothetical protein XELAEV_18039509mg [Xenopus laevis]
MYGSTCCRCCCCSPTASHTCHWIQQGHQYRPPSSYTLLSPSILIYITLSLHPHVDYSLPHPHIHYSLPQTSCRLLSPSSSYTLLSPSIVIYIAPPIPHSHGQSVTLSLLQPF